MIGRNIKRILGFLVGTLPSKYLGAAMMEWMIRKVLWQYLLDHMMKKLAGWVFRTLNLVGRLTLVNFLIHVMLIYLFLVLVSPKSILK